MIDLRDDHMQLVQRILAEHVPECEVWAFGSRVTWTAGDNSDLDLVVVGAGKLGWQTMVRIKDAFEESILPFRVDVLDWHAIPESFHKNIRKEYEVIQNPVMSGSGDEKSSEHRKIDGVERDRRSWVVGGDWLEYKLADLCDSIDYGFTTSAKSEPVGPKFLRITDIVSGHIDWDAVPYCESDQANTEKYLLYDKDIVIARTGANTGSSMFISAPPKAVFASYLIRLRVSEKAHSRFVSYFLKSPVFWAYMEGVLGDKSAQPNASAKTMTQVKLRLPPPPNQRAVAHILGSLDDKIELNRRMNKTLEAMARAVFKSWFVDFDPVRVRRGEPLCSPSKRAGTGACPYMPPEILNLFPDSFEDSELGEIPRGWEINSIGEVVRCVGGSTPSTKDPALSLPAKEARSARRVVRGRRRRERLAGVAKGPQVP